jgi:hypothetical protein
VFGMTRPLLAILGFGLGLICSVSACDGGDEGDEGVEKNECGAAWGDKDGMTPSVMDDFGAPCMTDSDCEPVLGANGVCVTNILGVYDLPGGFCSRECDLADTSVSFEHDSMQCAPEGGVTCVGAQGLYTSCIRECTSDSQCGREGYACRTMPTLAAEGDPKFCLMNVVDCCTTDSGECGE